MPSLPSLHVCVGLPPANSLQDSRQEWHAAAGVVHSPSNMLATPHNADSKCFLPFGLYAIRLTLAGFANNAASAFEVQLQQTFAPLTALSVLIHFQPYYPAIAKAFDGIAEELLASVSSLLDKLSVTASSSCSNNILQRMLAKLLRNPS